MDRRSQFITEVQAGVGDLPYTVTPTAYGFDLELDEAAARKRWLRARRSRKLATFRFLHQVHLGDDGTYSITDESYSESRRQFLGRPAHRSRTKGRIWSFGRTIIWRRNEQGKFVRVSDETFDSAEGRDIVIAAAGRLGLAQRMGTHEKVNLAFGIAGLAAVVISGIAVGLVLLL